MPRVMASWYSTVGDEEPDPHQPGDDRQPTAVLEPGQLVGAVHRRWDGRRDAPARGS